MKRLFAISAILVFALITAGCETAGDDPISPAAVDEQLQTVDLDSPTGGFTETDEEPLFGEPESFAAVDEGEQECDQYEDPLRNQERVREMERRDGVRIYRLRALWGRMIAAAVDTAVQDCCEVDWSGGMKLDGGVIVIERVLRFDANDELVRTAPNILRWKSTTCPHVDGVQVRLIVPPADCDSAGVDTTGNYNERPEPLLTISAGPFERTFTLEELEAMRLMEPVDRCNNYMTLASHRILPGCPSGHMMGEWIRHDEPDTLYSEETGEMRGVVYGHFRGIWISERGWAVGHLRGVYGVNSAGEQRFYGKYINPGGEFMGILAGDWNVYPTFAEDPLNDVGGFEGVWYGRNHGVKGRLKGEWVTSGGLGYFRGIWGMLCNDRI